MLNEFLYLYHLKAFTHYGYFELFPWDRKSRVVKGFPSSFRDWKSWHFFHFWNGLGNHVWWLFGVCAYFLHLPLVLYIYIYIYIYFLYHCCLPNNVYFSIFVALDHPELEDQQCSRVRVAFAFACEIEDFDDLIDPCHFFDCCLGLEPSKYMLEQIRWEEKSKIVYSLVLRILLSLLASSLLCLIAYLTFG